MYYKVEGYDAHNQELEVQVSATDAVNAMNKARFYYAMTTIMNVIKDDLATSQTRIPLPNLGVVRRGR